MAFIYNKREWELIIRKSVEEKVVYILSAFILDQIFKTDFSFKYVI